MTCRHPAADALPFFVNGTLSPETRDTVTAHLAACVLCRDELAWWRDVSGAVEADVAARRGRLPAALAFEQHRQTLGDAVGLLPALVAAQARVLPGGLWLSSVVALAAGFVIAWLAGRTGVLGAVIPAVSAFGMSRLYGPRFDPAWELTCATPTSPRQVLLARLVLVFSYDLALALAASTVLSAVVPGTLLGAVIGSWLAPMTFVSALALAASVVVGGQAAASVAFGVWVLRGVAGGIPVPAGAAWWTAAYEACWRQSEWLYVTAGVLSVWAVWAAGRGGRPLDASPG